MVVDRTVIGTPSSSAFRSEGAITLVLPTEAVLSRLELLFRYGMYRSWSGDDGPAGPAARLPRRAPEYQI